MGIRIKDPEPPPAPRVTCPHCHKTFYAKLVETRRPSCWDVGIAFLKALALFIVLALISAFTIYFYYWMQ